MAKSAAQRQADYRARNIESCQGRWRDYSYTEKGTITCLLNYAKDRARRAGLLFDLDRDWLKQKLDAGICEFSGIKLERVPTKRFRANPLGPSLDRIQPSLGYTKENTRLVCFAINRAKSDWGDDVLLLLAEAIVKKHITG